MRSCCVTAFVLSIGCGSSGTSSGGGATDSGPQSDSGAATEAGADAGAATDGGLLPFGSACASNAQCQGGACVSFPAKGGMRCTETCPPNPTDCPNGGAGCNNMGFCKVP